MIEYRLKNDTDVWHWAHACSKWPTFDYSVKRGEPNWGKKCPECQEKQKPEVLEE